MNVRLITTKEDLELAYQFMKQFNKKLAYYDFLVKFDFNNHDKHFIIGAFQNEQCLGVLTYRIEHLDKENKILEILDSKYSDIRSYKLLFKFIDNVASEDHFSAIKIKKPDPDLRSKKVINKLNHILRLIASLLPLSSF